MVGPCHFFIYIGGFVIQVFHRGGNKVNVAAPSVLNIAELLTPVDNDRELGRANSRRTLVPGGHCDVCSQSRGAESN
jgi:hypothetical protein